MSAVMNIVILIPAYKPEDKLCTLVQALSAAGMTRVLIVDDGGGADYAAIFARCRQLGATIETHADNRGKGAALKSGIAAILRMWPDAPGIVTADADGQHAVANILDVCHALIARPDHLILGSRAFVGEVPFKSRFGNAITRQVYRLVTGKRIHDTQTGLRGMPMQAAREGLAYPGNRYEWEMEQLLHTRLSIQEVPIQTIYENNNQGSHFSPVRDAARVYRVIFAAAFCRKKQKPPG